MSKFHKKHAVFEIIHLYLNIFLQLSRYALNVNDQIKGMSYTIEDHKHRYSAWAASRAASTRACRFKVLEGKNILEAVGLNKLIQNPGLLPLPTEIDILHRKWREAAISAAKAKGLTGFSHGIAAKLINVYLKGAFVCAGHESNASVAALHPPIDSLLLDELYKK